MTVLSANQDISTKISLHRMAIANFFALILKHFSNTPMASTDKECMVIHRYHLKRTPLAAFQIGLFSFLGFNSNVFEKSVQSILEKSPSDALKADCDAISHDVRRVYDRESALVHEEE